MDLLSQTALDIGASPDLVKASVHDGDAGIASSTPHCNEPQQPAKKPTRQWAAWTHQEEESFFTALRQVGKNFEKITRRVQSKNKDQVRHYYYRLVRRMNKLLGPELFLDAKNSKDTNAAMLRWWSLLEKYSCKASKLHLKPRRFKIFIEALENQLMKDRKKNVKKQPSLGENTSLVAPGSVTNHDRPSSNDPQMVKLAFVDSQNIQKLGTGRVPMKRNVSIGVIRGKKGDSTLIKPTRQRRKQGAASSVAYKRWEKAAIAGVSLVADAAEHLERAATDSEFQNEQAMPENKYDDNNTQNSLKLKLQLFPIDDATRRALEMDKHNPHLELTLGTRKKISSVMEHLNKKWGNSSVAGGQLMLFPYFAQRENLLGFQGWTQESVASAADVYITVGSPPVFRLRYGWFSNDDFALSNRQNSSPVDQTFRGEAVVLGKSRKVPDRVSSGGMSISDPSLNTVSSKRFELTAVNKNDTPTIPAFDAPNKMNGQEAKNELIQAPSIVQWCKNDGGHRNINKEYEVDGLRLNDGATISQGEWADSLTNISIGDLLSEVSPHVDHNCTVPASTRSDMYLHQTPFSCDSFDAAIAAHLSKHQKTMLPSTEAPQTYSIWDAEETCDAFSFQKSAVLRPEIPTSSVIPSPRVDKLVLKTSSIVTDAPHLEEFPEMDCLADKNQPNDCGPDLQSDGAIAKDFSALTDIYWPDSLGPLDMDLLTPKYNGNDLILSDSLSGFNRLIGSSLDAFQNCSFFGGQEGLITKS